MKLLNYIYKNCLKDIQDPYTESYKTVLREVKEDLSKWKYMSFS